MGLRQLVTAAATMIVAIVLAGIVPVAQLRTVADRAACCCPDPTTCKCFDHGDGPTDSTMRACHDQGPELVQTELASFVAPAAIVLEIPARPAVAALVALDDPHSAPLPRRPDAPS